MSEERGDSAATPTAERIHWLEAAGETKTMFLLRTDRRYGRRETARGRRDFHSCVEPLEGRSMLTGSGATIALSNGMIEILGTNLGDTGSVSIQNGSVQIRVSNSRGSDDVAFPLVTVQSPFWHQLCEKGPDDR